MGPAEIVLGQRYREVVTGFTGIATARTEHWNGSVFVMLERDAPIRIHDLEPQVMEVSAHRLEAAPAESTE